MPPLSPRMLILATLMSAPFAAQPALAQNSILPSQIERMAQMRAEQAANLMRKNPSQAKTQYIGQAFAIDPDGNVTAEKLRRQQLRDKANMRARTLVRCLGYDLDADGILSEAELQEAEQYAINSAQRAQIRMLRIGSDVNGDGAIDIAEMYVYADKTQRQNLLGIRNFDALLTMDGNGDGTTTIDEIVAHIDAVAAAPEPARAPRPTIGIPRPLPKQ